MKITQVNTYTVRPRWGFVEIITDDGITGWGEPVLEGHCSTVLACVQEMKDYLIGADPMKIEDIWSTLYYYNIIFFSDLRSTVNTKYRNPFRIDI